MRRITNLPNDPRFPGRSFRGSPASRELFETGSGSDFSPILVTIRGTTKTPLMIPPLIEGYFLGSPRKLGTRRTSSNSVMKSLGLSNVPPSIGRGIRRNRSTVASAKTRKLCVPLISGSEEGFPPSLTYWHSSTRGTETRPFHDTGHNARIMSEYLRQAAHFCGHNQDKERGLFHVKQAPLVYFGLSCPGPEPGPP
jgi:hypothetical protein